MIDPNDIQRRRTFAIISHPDAGKTTLTEKMLLYGGALHLAGAVKARKNQRATASDWMELEKKRGISISSTVMQFDYAGHRINLLDTPGHRDFSEDTYRVLTAVDSAIMVIDAAKGLERQTLKLFEVCRKRGIPIFTFVNKLDAPAREPLELIDEIERVLGLAPCPVNWPMGSGTDFRGVYDRFEKRAHLYERTPGGAFRAPVTVRDLSDPALAAAMDERPFAQFKEEIDMLDAAGAPFDPAAVRAGATTPVFFGSALSNFGVDLLLEGFVRHAPPPGPKRSRVGVVTPDRPDFSGFIFKIQGNMDPQHRDRVAFVRVCSGRFERNMQVYHSGTGKTFRLANSHKLFGREREVVEEACAGDILGLIGYPDFRIGDTLSEDREVVYREIPRFPPECFAYFSNRDPTKSKAWRKGLGHFVMEGIVQPFRLRDGGTSTFVVGAVGPLQFEVLQYRMATEYNAPSTLEAAPFECVGWLDPADMPKFSGDSAILPFGGRVGFDGFDRPVILFQSEWHRDYFRKKHEAIRLSDTPPDATGEASATVEEAEALERILLD